MENRYRKTNIITNNKPEYSDLLLEKKLSSIKHYGTFDFSKLRTIHEKRLDMIVHIVKPYEKLYNISQKYYQTPEYGWVICYTNKLANEMLISEGTSLIIYVPIEKVLDLL